MLLDSRSHVLGHFVRTTKVLAILPALQSSWNPFPVPMSSRHYCVAREARFMKKLVTGTGHTRKKWFSGESSSAVMKDMSDLLVAQPGVYRTNAPKTAAGGRTLRRVGVLSNVFMEHITDLLATGDHSSDIAGLGLEITQVSMSSDFTHLMVYWYTSTPEKEDQLDSVLKSSSSNLRHNLSQIRVIGHVPPIVFVKDTKYIKIMEVEKIIANLDFGPDYELSPLRHSEKLVMSTKKFKHKKTSKISQTLENSLYALENPLPPTRNDTDSGSDERESEADSDSGGRQDVLGLDWGRIMGEINLQVAQAARKHLESKTPRRIDKETEAVPKHQLAEDISNSVNRQKEFLEFLKQRRINQRKMERLLSNEAAERAFYEEEKLRRRIDLTKSNDFSDLLIEQDDYLENDLDYVKNDSEK